MKTALYAATTARAYRLAIDDYFESEEKYRFRLAFYQEEVSKCTNRTFSTGFYFGRPDEKSQIYDSSTYVKEYTYYGTAEEITASGLVVLTQKNKFSVGETLEIMKPDGRNLSAGVLASYDEEGNAMESCPHAKQRIFVGLDAEIEEGDVIRSLPQSV